MPAAPRFEASFLAPLTQPDAETYARILFDLYAEACRASQPLPRAVVFDIIIRHTLSPAEEPLARARALLGELEAAGWLRTEVQPDFTAAVALTPQAFQFLQARQAALAPDELVVAVHDLLKSVLLDVDNGARLNAAARLTDQLVIELKVSQHTAAQARLPADTARQRAAVLEAAAKLEARGQAQAAYIRQQFAMLEKLLADLAARQARLARPAAQPSSTGPRLARLIREMAGFDKKAFGARAAELLHLYHQPAARPGDLGPEPAREFIPVAWPAPQVTEAELEQARRRVRRQLNRPVTPGRVRRLAQQFIRGRAGARAAELVAENLADLPLLIQLRLHADSDLGYIFEEGPWAEVSGLVFRDFHLKNPDYTPPFAPLPPDEAPQGSGETAEVQPAETSRSLPAE